MYVGHGRFVGGWVSGYVWYLELSREPKNAAQQMRYICYGPYQNSVSINTARAVLILTEGPVSIDAARAVLMLTGKPVSINTDRFARAVLILPTFSL